MTISIAHATDVLLKDCIFYDLDILSINIESDVISNQHTLKLESSNNNDLNLTLESCTFNHSGAAVLTLIWIMNATYATLNDCTFTNSNIKIFANNAMVGDCTLTRSPLVIMDAEYAILKDCTFEDTYPHKILIARSSTVILSKLRIFGQEDNWELSDNTNILLKDCHIETTVVNINKCNATITGDSAFTTSNILAQFSSITMSGNVSVKNYHGFNGAMFLDSSNLTIAAGAGVTFFNNSAQNSGGALLIMLSNFYIEAGANVKFINNSANDKGGAIYIQPGVGSFVSEISININSKCLFQFINGEKWSWRRCIWSYPRRLSVSSNWFTNN